MKIVQREMLRHWNRTYSEELAENKKICLQIYFILRTTRRRIYLLVDHIIEAFIRILTLKMSQYYPRKS